MNLHTNAQRSADLCQSIRTGETQSQRVLIGPRAGVATSPPRVLSGWSKNRLWNNGRQVGVRTRCKLVQYPLLRGRAK